MDEVKKHIKDCFKGLTFEEKEHKYFFEGNPLSLSVSGKIKQFVEPFDSDTIAGFSARKQGVSKEEILASWKKAADEACEKGNKAHLFGEVYAFNREIRPQTQLDIAIMKFWGDLPPHIIPAFVELQMFHKTEFYAGTSDILLYNILSGKYIIADYKTNKDLFKNYKDKKLLGPFSNLLDTPYNKYQIQLSYYQKLFEQTGLEVSHRKIIWLQEVNGVGEYKIYDTENYTQFL